MSSLSSQLNALSGQRTATRAHSETTGRGFGFTANSGYAGQGATEDSARFKATILYDDARKAAEVGKGVLRDNASKALIQLGSTHSDPILTSFSTILCSPNQQNSSRSLLDSASNAKLNSTITKLLSHLLPYLPSPPTLHVLEYLIRRYSVHTYLPREFLLSLLPYHSTPYFERALTLVNVAEDGMLRWLRPYARQESNGLAREEISKQCVKDLKLVEEILNVGVRANDAWKDVHSRSNSTVPICVISVPTVVSTVISFATNVVLDSLTLQSKSTPSTLPDKTLRTLLPYIAKAFNEEESKDMRESGYVVAIKIASCVKLQQGAMEVLGTGIMKGAAGVEAKINAIQEGEGSSLRALENYTDAVLVMIAVFYQKGDPSEVELPISTFKALTKSKLLPKALAVLHAKHKVNVMGLIKSIVKRVAQYLCTKLGSRYVKLLDILLNNPALNTVFTPAFLSSLTLTVLTNYDQLTSSTSPKSNNEEFLTLKTNSESLINAMVKKDREGVERGIGNVVEGSKGKANPNLNNLISTTLNLPASSLPSTSALPLPPTVALTSPSTVNRLEALSTLDSLLSSSSSVPPNYLHSILQTFISDTYAKVQTLAGKIFLKHSKSYDVSVGQALEIIDKYALSLSTPTSHYKSKETIRSKNKQKTLTRLITANEQAIKICKMVKEPTDQLTLKVASHLSIPSPTLYPYPSSSLHSLSNGTLEQLHELSFYVLPSLPPSGPLDPKSRSTYAVLFNIENPGHEMLVDLLRDGEMSDDDKIAVYNHLLPNPSSLSLESSLLLQTSLASLDLPPLPPLPNLQPHHLLELTTSFKPVEYESADRCIDSAIETMKKFGKKSGKKDQKDALIYALPASLSLLSHSERTTRKKSLVFLSMLAPLLPSPLDSLATQASSNFALELEMDSTAFPNFLGKVSLNNEPLKKALLTTITTTFTHHTHLSLAHVSTPTLLFALENAGDGTDDLFPLALRWEHCGKPIFSHFLDFDEDLTWSDPRVNVLKTVTRMIRCVAGDGTGSGLGIVSNGNGRVRKYSVSESSFVEPPKTLLDAMEDGLDIEKSNAIIRDLVAGVMKKHSWVDHVFLSLTDDRKLSISSLLLRQRVEGEGGSSSILSLAFENLILGTSQVSTLLEGDTGTEEQELIRLTLVAEYVQSENGKSTVKGAEGCNLFKILFNKLYEVARLSSEVGGAEYCKNTIIGCLLEIGPSVVIPDEKQQKKKGRRRSSSLNGNSVVKSGGELEKAFHNYSELCISLIEGTEKISGVKGPTATKNVLGLLSVLTDKCPSIAKMLLPVLKLVAERDEVDDSRSFTLTTECMQSIIPSFCRSGAKSGLRLFDLIRTFVEGYEKIRVHRKKSFFSTFIATISSVKKNVQILGSVVGSLLAVGVGAEEMRTFVLSLVFSGPTSEQMHSMIKTLEYATELLGDVVGVKKGDGNKTTSIQPFYHVSHEDLLGLVGGEGGTEEIKRVIAGLLICMKTQLAHPTFPIIVRNTKKAQSALIETWEKLLRLRSNIVEASESFMQDEEEDDEFLAPVMAAVKDSLLLLQKMLDLPTFLVTMRVVVEAAGGGDADLCRESLVLLGERVKGVATDMPEHTLVLEFLPELIELIKGGEEGVVEVALNALAVTVTNLPGVSEHVKVLRSGLEASAGFIGKGNAGLSVCIESLLEKLGAKALPALPRLVGAVAAKDVEVVRSIVTHLGPFVAKQMEGIVSLVVKDDAVELGRVVVEHVKLRLLIPVVKKLGNESLAVGLAVKSVEGAQKKEIGAVFEDLMALIIDGLGKCAREEIDAFDAYNDLTLAVLMRQSEKKMRLVSKRMEDLREEGSAGERVYWSVAHNLGKNFRHLYLPCVSVEDVVARLGGFKNKKRKAGETNVGVEVVKVVLMMLCELLKGDSYDGGGWSQAEEGRRFKLLLKELSRLFLIDVGISREVSGCMVNLAAAGGSEILWKPLNHSVLEACSSEKMTVRKAGLSCLLDILNTVGEDYLGMLPECLPCLSERLEDDDEEVVRLARDCVNVAEELSGEELGEFLL